MNAKDLILFHNFDNPLFDTMMELCDSYRAEGILEEKTRNLHKCMLDLIDIAGEYGFYGNLWHCYLTNLLVNDENIYSLACERKGTLSGTLNKLVLLDLERIRKCFAYDFTEMTRRLMVPELNMIFAYQAEKNGAISYNRRISDCICALAMDLGKAENAEEMKALLDSFYQSYGVGKLGLHKAFRIVENKDGGADIVPILNIAHVHLDDLVGYEIPKKKLLDNTLAFLAKKPANNCLLFGDAGTGKSTSIKAITNAYYERGLRVIEIYKHQFHLLNDVIAQIKNRQYRFIIYMDDLSFEDFEIEYKYLKAIIEGGLEKKPENVLIYATSNRRHLVREKYSDKEEEFRQDMHTSDTVQEKLSLSARFGETIYFGAPSKKEFQQIVLSLAAKEGILMEQDALLAAANQWEITHGGRSGRSARAFITYLLGHQA